MWSIYRILSLCFCFDFVTWMSRLFRPRRVTDVDKVLEWLEGRSWSSRNLGCKFRSNEGKNVRWDLCWIPSQFPSEDSLCLCQVFRRPEALRARGNRTWKPAVCMLITLTMFSAFGFWCIFMPLGRTLGGCLGKPRQLLCLVMMMMMMMISYRNIDILWCSAYTLTLYFWSAPGNRRQHPWADDALVFLWFFEHRSRSGLQRSLWIEPTWTRPSGSWCCCSSTCQGLRIFGLTWPSSKTLDFWWKKSPWNMSARACGHILRHFMTLFALPGLGTCERRNESEGTAAQLSIKADPVCKVIAFNWNINWQSHLRRLQCHDLDTELAQCHNVFTWATLASGFLIRKKSKKSHCPMRHWSVPRVCANGILVGTVVMMRLKLLGTWSKAILLSISMLPTIALWKVGCKVQGNCFTQRHCTEIR